MNAITDANHNWGQVKNSTDLLLRPLKDKQRELLIEAKRLQTARVVIESLGKVDEQRCMLADLKRAHDFLQSSLASVPGPVHHEPCKLVLGLSHSLAQELDKLKEFLCGIAPEKAPNQDTSQDTPTPTPVPLQPFSLGRRHPAGHVQRQHVSTSAHPTGAMEHPSGICIHPLTGTVCVADEGQQRLLLFDPHLALLSSHPTELSVRKTHHGPRGVALSASGTLAVADFGGNCVKIFNPDMVLVREVGGRSKVCGVGLSRPYAVAFDPDENLYVADSGNRRVLRLCTKTASASGSAGAIEQALKLDLQPDQVLIGVAVTEAGDILTLISGSDQVGLFGWDGRVKRFIRVQPTSPNGWSSIFYRHGGLFGICDNTLGFVVLYDMDGLVQATLPLEGCRAACFAPDGVLYATSTAHNSVVAL